MVKNFLAIVLVALLVVLGWQIWENSQTKEIPIPPDHTIRAVKQTIIQGTAQDNYLIKIEYPKIEGLKNINSQKNLNQGIYDSIDNMSKDFRKTLKGMNNLGVSLETKNSLTVSYLVNRLDDQVASIEIDKTTYFTGQAHPLTVVKTINYNIPKNQEINLVSLLGNIPSYQDILATLTYRDLASKFKANLGSVDTIIKSGTTPKINNFQNFLIGQNNLVIIFDQCFAAPCSEGVQKVTIPFTDLGQVNL